MIVIVKTWRITFFNYDCSCYHCRCAQGTRSLQDGSDARCSCRPGKYEVVVIGLDWIGLPLCWRSSTDLRTPGSDLHPSVGRGTDRSGCQSQCSHPAPSSSPLMMMMMYQGWGWSWWWFFWSQLSHPPPWTSPLMMMMMYQAGWHKVREAGTGLPW